ncbi:gas vesicle protein [Streptomyces sp. HNM0575]|uniref:gas vesicle protein n=1 Tax=Streptomyces sp. HNM0575 TaxID=2716338 RepID=UPI001F0E1435|nr:gas vesicle protein [Streptomyces sp. HNM0575]
MGPSPNRAVPYGQQGSSANLADILERVLDKGVVIAGDIQINLLDIELLTIKLRLLVVSVDKAKEMGIDWWENDPSLSSRASARAAADGRRQDAALADGGAEDGSSALAEENDRLRREIERLRSAAELPAGDGTGAEASGNAETSESTGTAGAGDSGGGRSRGRSTRKATARDAGSGGDGASEHGR